MLFFGRRGRENQRNMVKEDGVFRKTANGLERIALRERATKNHPRGLRDNEDNCMRGQIIRKDVQSDVVGEDNLVLY